MLNRFVIKENEAIKVGSFQVTSSNYCHAIIDILAGNAFRGYLENKSANDKGVR